MLFQKADECKTANTAERKAVTVPFDAIVSGSVAPPVLPKPDSPIYRVRKAWNDIESQIGAFLELDKAKFAARETPGYSVYGPTGTAVYSPWNDAATVQTAVADAFSDGVITDKAHWIAVLTGAQSVDAAHLLTLLQRYHAKAVGG